MSTEVFVQMDGIVNHRHGGIKGWHNPATKHQRPLLHVTENAAVPTNLNNLTPSEQRQYSQALGGQSFYDRYYEALASRRAESGASWPYNRRRRSR
jgi:hypothetical protein